MSDYPTLTEMDVKRTDQIKHYTLHQEGNDGDVLKIFYERQKGSFLPDRKTFRFGRSAKMISTGDIHHPTREIHEISPFLIKAIAELDELIAKRGSIVDQKQHIIERMAQIEQEIKSAHEEIRSLLQKL